MKRTVIVERLQRWTVSVEEADADRAKHLAVAQAALGTPRYDVISTTLVPTREQWFRGAEVSQRRMTADTFTVVKLTVPAAGDVLAPAAPTFGR